MDIELEKVQIMLDWVKTKLFLHMRVNSAKDRVVKRGQVYNCNFGRGVGSEMEKDRPCVILQNNIGNLNSPNTIVAPITHDSSTLPCMVPITTRKDSNGDLLLDGNVNTSNIVCVSKARLGDHITMLTPREMKTIDESVAKSIGLMHYYGNINKQLQTKLAYIENIKKDRNKAQDNLKMILTALGVTNVDDAITKIAYLKNAVDK